MFLLNSRAPLSLRPAIRMAGTPSPKVTGPICRFPLARLPQHALAYSARGTSVGSRYGDPGSQRRTPFSRTPGHSQTTHKGMAIQAFTMVLAITALPRLQPLNRTKIPLSLPRSVRSPTQRHRKYLDRTGILTCYPFDQNGHYPRP